MGIERVSSIPAAAATAALSGTTPRPAGQSDQPARSDTETQGLVEIDKVTRQPVPPRFPWLSRLSNQLQSAAGTPAPFDPAPFIGEKIDRVA